MKNGSRMVLSMCLAVGCAGMVRAQEQSVPMVLQITREWVKPARAGTAHDIKADPEFWGAKAVTAAMAGEKQDAGK